MEILEYIWGDRLEVRVGENLPPLAAVLSSLLAAPMICFTTKQNGATSMHPTVSVGGQEVMPGATLADVLFEEFGIEISDETIVLIEPLSGPDAPALTSQQFGQSLGQILVELAELGQPTSEKASSPSAHALTSQMAHGQAPSASTGLVQ